MCVKRLFFRIFDSPMILLVLTPHPLYGFFGFLFSCSFLFCFLLLFLFYFIFVFYIFSSVYFFQICCATLFDVCLDSPLTAS